MLVCRSRTLVHRMDTIRPFRPPTMRIVPETMGWVATHLNMHQIGQAIRIMARMGRHWCSVVQDKLLTLAMVILTPPTLIAVIQAGAIAPFPEFRLLRNWIL